MIDGSWLNTCLVWFVGWLMGKTKKNNNIWSADAPNQWLIHGRTALAIMHSCRAQYGTEQSSLLCFPPDNHQPNWYRKLEGDNKVLLVVIGELSCIVASYLCNLNVLGYTAYKSLVITVNIVKTKCALSAVISAIFCDPEVLTQLGGAVIVSYGWLMWCLTVILSSFTN